MLIRHDLKLVFVHVPKCAGKALREILTFNAPKGSIEVLWSYKYCNTLHRYVDLAHLPMSDLRCYKQFEYLDKYKVIACIRNPYSRLLSAVNEYYRQRNSIDEEKVKQGRISKAMKQDYYDQLLDKHPQHDPRTIHSLPIHYFTHFATEPKVDYLIRCEDIKSEFLTVANKLKLPIEILQLAEIRLFNKSKPIDISKLSKLEIELANLLYEVDFNTFEYRKKNINSCRYSNMLETDPSKIKQIHFSKKITWHWHDKPWGPASAINDFPTKLEPSR